MRFSALLAAIALLLPAAGQGQGRQGQAQHVLTYDLVNHRTDMLHFQFLHSGNASRQEPPANIRLTFHLIEADGFTNDDPEIAAVVTELRRIFRFRGYRLAFTSILNASPIPVPKGPNQVGGIDGHANVSQRTLDLQGREFRVDANITTEGEQVRVSVELHGYSTPGGPSRQLISASVNLTSGKTVVLGSTRTDASSGALILAVTSVFDP